MIYNVEKYKKVLYRRIKMGMFKKKPKTKNLITALVYQVYDLPGYRFFMFRGDRVESFSGFFRVVFNITREWKYPADITNLFLEVREEARKRGILVPDIEHLVFSNRLS
jgi:hypothetical protein